MNCGVVMGLWEEIQKKYNSRSLTISHHFLSEVFDRLYTAFLI